MKYPNFGNEKRLWKRGFKIVAGVDEVGRGALAGPVVAGCVAFSLETVARWQAMEIRIDDSKKLTPRQREEADDWIKKNCLTWGIGEAPVRVINKLGIKKATEMAFRRAIAQAQERRRIDYLVLDAFYVPYVRGLRRKNQEPIVKGDAKSYSIAAASVIAKVYRDGLMAGLGKWPKFRKYRWDKNKGYGTLDHRMAITKFGLTRYHRKRFLRRLD